MKALCDFTTIPLLHGTGEQFGFPSCFLPLMGKAFVQHVIEYVERLGIRKFDIHLSQYADDLERFIGDGERWGVEIAYHLVKRKTSMGERMANAAHLQEGELALVCNTLWLPFAGKDSLSVRGRFVAQGDLGTDTGWAVCTREDLAGNALESLVPVEVESIGIGSASLYLEALRSVLVRKGDGLIVIGKEIRDGVWAGPGTRIPASATIVAPVYLGSQVNVGELSIIGPDAEIGNGCIIDKNSAVIGSSVLPGSFVGANLDVRGCIVNQNKILNAALSTVYVAADEMLASAVEETQELSRLHFVSTASRLLAALLALATSPVLLILLLAKKFKREDVVRAPQYRDPVRASEVRTFPFRLHRNRAETQGSLWRHFVWHLIPGLALVVAGKARFVGIPLKTVEEFSKISSDWKGLYLRSKPGLIGESDVLYREFPGEEMLFAAEMYHSVMDNRSYSIKLVGRYLAGLLGITRT